uniref:TLC domain-containing protein n=1 Tax=viral metagenome TaxID=1070528 RepID=A0A6C0BAI5_9ZZZZ
MEGLYIVPAVLFLNTFLSYNLVAPFEKYRKLKDAHKYELLNRITGCLFQLFIVYNGLYMKTDDVLRITSQMTGYMIFELLYMPLYLRSPAMYIHHILYILAFIAKDYSPKEDLEAFASISYILESTAPLFTLVWCLEKFECPKNFLSKSVQIVAVSYWTCIRIVLVPYMIYKTRSHVIYFFGAPFYLLQLYWFSLILKRMKNIR